MARLTKPLALCAAFTSVLALVRVDTHFHAVPPAYGEAVAAAGGDPSGFPTPQWTLDGAIQFMNRINTDIGGWILNPHDETLRDLIIMC